MEMGRTLIAISTTRANASGVLSNDKWAVEVASEPGVFEANEDDFDIGFAAKAHTAPAPPNRETNGGRAILSEGLYRHNEKQYDETGLY